MDIFSGLGEEELQLFFSAFLLSAQLAFYSSIILLLICTPVAWFLSRQQSWPKYLIQAVLNLPLVLPPSVLGFYLLILFRPDSFLGQLWFHLSQEQLLFSFSALLIASVIYSFPFVLQPLLTAFEQTDRQILDLGKTLGAKPMDLFAKVVLPMNKNAYFIAFALAFAHTLGEFGVVLFVGGNIAGETRVISIAMYDQVELMNYDMAHLMAMAVLMLSMCLLIPVYALNGNLLKFPLVRHSARTAH